MTYPLRDNKCQGGKRRVAKQGEPFDPEELSRRLKAHLVEQKLQAERRRTRAAAVQKNGVYHHVPMVAAADFARTATPEAMLHTDSKKRHVHKLAQPALKQHLEHLTLDDSIPGRQLTGVRRTQAMDQAMAERDTARCRNQFQWNRDMEEAAEVDIDRDLYKPPQRTFDSEFSHLRSGQVRSAQRPLSTGDVFWEEEESHTHTRPKAKPAYVANDRNDWAQRDENEVENRRSMKERVTPFLLKKDSIWVLKGRKEKSTKVDKDEAVAGVSEVDLSPDPNKTGRGSFLARFKRHPS